MTAGAKEAFGGAIALGAGLGAATKSCFDCSAPLLATTGAGGTSGLLAQQETSGLLSEPTLPSSAGGRCCIEVVTCSEYQRLQTAVDAGLARNSATSR